MSPKASPKRLISLEEPDWILLGEPQGPAIDRINATFEVLELIFLHLSLEKVSQIQRVCQRWKFVIAKSPRLQRHLFLRAMKGGPFRLVDDHGRRYVENTATGSKRHVARTKDICKLNPQIEHLLLSLHKYPEGAIRILQQSISRGILNYHQDPHSVRLALMPIPQRLQNRWYAQECHSWRCMFLTQPPCTSAAIYTIVDAPSSQSIHKRRHVHTVSNLNGVTVGQVIGALAAWQFHRGCFDLALEFCIDVQIMGLS